MLVLIIFSNNRWEMSSPEAWGLFLHLGGCIPAYRGKIAHIFHPCKVFHAFLPLCFACGLVGGAGARQGGFLRILVPIVGGNVYF